MSLADKCNVWRKRLRVAAFVAVPTALIVYLLYFTPEKRAVRHHLGAADTKSRSAIDERTKPVRDLFAAGRKGAPAFAKEVLSLGGKWELLRSVVAPDDYKEFLADAFARHIFSPNELKAVIVSSCAAYMSDLDAFEAEMLVGLRADLADRPVESLPPHLRSNEEFARQYQILASRVTAETGSDLAVALSREAVMIVVSEVITRASIQAAQSVASELGIQCAALSSGTVSFIATCGLGLVIYVIIDYVVDALFKAAGYDPEEKVASAILTSLDKMEAALLSDAGLRRRVGMGQHGTLRAELEKIHEVRAARRQEAIRLMLKEGGAR